MWEGERIRKLTTQRACHRGSNIKGAEWDAHGRIAAGLPTPRINARQSQPQTTPMYQTTTPPNPWRDKVKSARNQYCTWNEPARGMNQTSWDKRVTKQRIIWGGPEVRENSWSMTTIKEEYQDRPAHRMRMQGSTRKSHKLQVLIQCANHARHDSNACAATNP